MAEALGVELSRALPLALVYVRVSGLSGTDAVDAACTPRGPVPTSETRGIGRTLERFWERRAAGEETPTIPDPLGNGTLRLTQARLGHAGDWGIVVAGSHDPRFPSRTDQLVLDVAAARTTIVLQRRRSEEQRRRHERELADVFENATVALHWLGPDGTVLRANRAELELLGYAPDEYVGHDIAEFHADPDVICDVLRRLQRGEDVREVEAHLRCKDGSIKHVLIRANVLWEDGKFVHARCFTSDIADRRRAEEALRGPTDLFTTLVEHIPDIVSRLDRDLRFLYISPAVTRATGRPWQEYIGKPRTNQGVPPEYVQMREALSRKVFETGQEQRLEFPMQTPAGPRFMKCRFVPEFAPDGSVESLMTLVRNVTEQKRAEERLRLLWEAAAVLLTANDPDGMLRELFARIGPHVGVDVYFNHVVDESGEALRLASCEGIAVEAARTIARLKLGDAVAGTAALRRQPIVVSSIQHSDDPQVRLLKSFGIRTCICHPLVAEKRLLGTLSFASRSDGIGKGSEFTVRLPMLAETPSARQIPEADGNGQARPATARRILVVDDNRDSADSLAMLLQISGNDVETAYDGAEALEAADRLRPDVVLLDIGMPKLNGHDACRRIRAEPWGRGMVLIALTGWGQEQDRRRPQEAGFDAHVVKPVDPNALLPLLGPSPRPSG